MVTKVRESFTEPDYSDFTKECVRVGEAMEAMGFTLEAENYSQGEQSFSFRRGDFRVEVLIGEWEEDWETGEREGDFFYHP